jgi:hypothetical protein
MSWGFAGRLDLCCRGVTLFLLTAAWAASLCGCSQQSATSTTEKSAEALLKPEDLYRYEGTGKAKRKVAISRRERMKMLHETTKTLESK